MIPYIGLFHVAQDNKLDYVGTLLGDDIHADALIQALVLAEDMHLHLLTEKKMPNNPELNQIPDFRPREETRDSLPSSVTNGVSKNQRLSERVPKPKADNYDVVNDPDEEEKELPIPTQKKQSEKFDINNLSLKERQRLEYEEAKLLDLQRLEKQKAKENEKLEQEKHEQQKQDEIDLKAAESLSKLAEEPAEDDPNAATIQIRLPDGSKSVTRRFLKTARVEELYLYVRSLGEEAGFEDPTNDFELLNLNTVSD